MALQSWLLKGQPALEAAAKTAASHVAPGAVGAHVGRVQDALCLVDSAVIDPAERRTLTYGPSTAAAVLSYKRQRAIINRSYQTTADDIVGVMTLARLDADLVALARSASSQGERCAVCGGWDRRRHGRR